MHQFHVNNTIVVTIASHSFFVDIKLNPANHSLTCQLFGKLFTF